MSPELAAALREEWRCLRDDAKRYDGACAVVVFLHGVGMLTADDAELWARRFETCPGHDDEGGRDWCAYCGNMRATTAKGGRT